MTPYQWQWNLGFEYQVSPNTVISAGYTGTRTHRLTCPILVCVDEVSRADLAKFGSQVVNSVANPFLGIITDPRAALSQPTVQLGQLLKQNPQFSFVTMFLPPYQGPREDTFQAAWDGLEVRVSTRSSKGISLYVAYTLSKNITNADSFEAGFLGPTVGYQDHVDFQGERSLSAEDVTHRLVVGHVYDLPLGRGKRFGDSWPSAVDKVLGHWQFSGMTTFQGGFPLPISEVGHTLGTFANGLIPGTDRPNLVRAPAIYATT